MTTKNDFWKSISTSCAFPAFRACPTHAADVAQAAEWVAERMRSAGIENVQIMQTGGHPVVYGDRLHAAGKPTVMIYGHFDTQPVDPLHLWKSPPFEPEIRDGRVYAAAHRTIRATC